MTNNRDFDNFTLLEDWEKSKGKMSRAEFAEAHGMTQIQLNGRLVRAKRKLQSGKKRGKKRATMVGDGNTLVLTSAPSDRILGLDELLAVFGVDLDTWIVDHWMANNWESFRKDIDKDITFTQGVMDGHVVDDGGVNIVPLFQTKAWLVRKSPIALEPVVTPVALNVTRYKKSRTKSNLDGLNVALVIPDLHFGFERDLMTNKLINFHDRDYLAVVLAMINDIHPDVIVLLGDNLDLADWSDKFVRSPGFYFTTQPAINELAWWLAQIRLACPDAEIYYIEGNHEKRMEDSIIGHMAASYHLTPANENITLPAMSIPRLLDLEALDIKWVGNYPDGMVWLNEGLRCVHGDKARSIPGGSARAILESTEVDIIFGHVHRKEIMTKTRHTPHGSRVIKAICPGFGGRLDYVIPGHTNTQNWSQGLAVAYYDNAAYNSVEAVDVKDGLAIYGGKLYESDLNMARLRAEVNWNGL